MKKVLIYTLPVVALLIFLIGKGRLITINVGSTWVALSYGLLSGTLIVIWLLIVLMKLIIKR
ncbi:hypothetical protein SAMN05421740_10563 [Parapedobacter koreensis]|uniref:Uncharacterized protein n=1 Tax=Parapedobacter koreensis TaxID=332977 RepID=A0A1H7PY73_9SPHI|nr:hypothetical protein SAMN05421740_10563 [Parapedobacter koreensis]